MPKNDKYKDVYIYVHIYISWIYKKLYCIYIHNAAAFFKRKHVFFCIGSILLINITVFILAGFFFCLDISAKHEYWTHVVSASFWENYAFCLAVFAIHQKIKKHTHIYIYKYIQELHQSHPEIHIDTNNSKKNINKTMKQLQEIKKQKLKHARNHKAKYQNTKAL